MNNKFSALGWGLHIAAELLLDNPMSSSREKVTLVDILVYKMYLHGGVGTTLYTLHYL